MTTTWVRRSSWIAATAVLVVVAAGVVACSNDTDDALDRSPEPTVTLRTDPPPTTTTTTFPTTTSLPTTTTVHEPTPPDLPPCTTNMGTTLREDLRSVGPSYEVPTPPDDWEPPPQEGFDWDQDGQPDTLTIGEPDGTVTLTWASGSLTITGITTRFDQPLVDGLGVTHDARPPHLLDGIKPAYVADVTGDGWLDLLLIDQGTVSILAGAGDQTPTGTLPFESIGTDTLGWTNPPVTAPWPQHPNQEPQFDISLPEPHSSINATVDNSGDGVADLMASGTWERARGHLVFYDGISCRAR